jgi:hypothetical protein
MERKFPSMPVPGHGLRRVRGPIGPNEIRHLNSHDNKSLPELGSSTRRLYEPLSIVGSRVLAPPLRGPAFLAIHKGKFRGQANRGNPECDVVVRVPGTRKRQMRQRCPEWLVIS